MTMLSAFLSFGSAGQPHYDRPPARPRQCPATPRRSNHPPAAARPTLSSSDLPAVHHACESALRAPFLHVVTAPIASKATARVGTARRPVNVSRNTRFTLRYGTHVDDHCFPSTQEPTGVRETAGTSKARPAPTILVIPLRYGARSRFPFTSSVTTQARRHAPFLADRATAPPGPPPVVAMQDEG